MRCFVLRVSVSFPGSAGSTTRGFIWLAASFDTKLIHARAVVAVGRSLPPQSGPDAIATRANRYLLVCVQINLARAAFLQCVPDPGMSQVAALLLPGGCFWMPGTFRSKAMVFIGEGHQVEAERPAARQALSGGGGGNLPIPACRLLLFYHCVRLKIS